MRFEVLRVISLNWTKKVTWMDTYKNITLPQTSFGGGNKKVFQSNVNRLLADNTGFWNTQLKTETTENITFATPLAGGTEIGGNSMANYSLRRSPIASLLVIAGWFEGTKYNTSKKWSWN